MQSMGGCLPSKSQNVVLFFPDAKLPCNQFYEQGSCRFGDKCRYSHSATNLTRLCDYLRGAKSSIKICVFNITCDFISTQIKQAHQRGVKVQIISDDAQSKSQGSDIDEFIKEGIPVRTDKQPTHMHHKFCIIDDKYLVNGSFNWTVSAVTGNAENVVITSKPTVVRPFIIEFGRLWQKYA